MERELHPNLMAALEREFTFDEPGLVKAFLAATPSLAAALPDAANLAGQYFNAPQLSLEVVADMGLGREDTLLVHIHLNPDTPSREATKQLHAFRRAWAAAQPGILPGLVVFSVA